MLGIPFPSGTFRLQPQRMVIASLEGIFGLWAHALAIKARAAGE